jgi:GrpB-like predicted nucleotidyltransferase (UPF0157 family)
VSNKVSKEIQVLPYNANWPHIFEKEASLIRQVLADNYLAIHHIGSTAIPGLDAKEDIDICVVVKNLQKDLKFYRFKGELNIPLRYFFNKNTQDSKVNLHMVEADNGFIDLNLRFRDHLISNDEARNAYADLKYELLKNPAALQKNNMNFSHYTLGKYCFINKVLDKAGFNAIRVMHCMHPVEWKAAKRFRNTYLFHPHGIEDVSALTFNDQGHAHLVLYLGTRIIGYAHIKFYHDKRASIRIIAINKQNKIFASKFLALIKKWLKLLGMKGINEQSRQSNLRFYLKNG